jgi:hypothetical protein
MKNLLTYILLLFTFNSFSSKDIPYTIDDRNRMIRLEVELKSTNQRINSLRNEMNAKFDGIENKFDGIENKFDGINAKFDSQQRQLDDIKSYFIWFSGIIISLIILLIGFIIWDRRLVMKPI